MLVLLFLLNAAFAAPGCVTKEAVKVRVCWALCRRDGYDTGGYVAKEDSCVCGRLVKFSEMTEVVIKIPSDLQRSLSEPPDPW